MLVPRWGMPSPDPADEHVDVVINEPSMRVDVLVVQAKHNDVVMGLHYRPARLRWFRYDYWRQALQIGAELAASYASSGLWVLRHGPSPHRLAGLAVFLAGRRRSVLADEWRAHLVGWPGRGLSLRDQTRAARGFLWAAVRYRLGDAADLAWRPVDSMLRSRAKSNLFVWLPVLAAVLAVVHHDGWYGLIANAENLIETWAGFYATVRVGRWYRKVRPPEPKPRRAKE